MTDIEDLNRYVFSAIWRIILGVTLLLTFGTLFYVGLPHTLEMRPEWGDEVGGNYVDGPALGYLSGMVLSGALFLSGVYILKDKGGKGRWGGTKGDGSHFS